MRAFSLFVLFLVATLWAGAPAVAVNGEALGVNPGAEASLGSNVRILQVGSDLAIGETVVTDANGQVQIRFEDKTELVVGPNSRLTLEDYLLRGDGSAGKFAINALAGTFRFVTGSAAKSRYQIATPTGTIGIRGTAFDFTVTPKQTDVLLYHGATVLCSVTGDCVTLDDPCEVGTYKRSDSEVLGLTKKLQRSTRDELSESFRYASNQRPLRSDFRISEAQKCFSKTQAELIAPKARLVEPVDPCANPADCAPPPPPPPPSPPPSDGGGGSGCTADDGSCEGSGGVDQGDDEGDEHSDNGHHYGNDKGDNHEDKGNNGNHNGQGHGNNGNGNGNGH